MATRNQETVSRKEQHNRRLLKGALLVLSAGTIIQPTGAVTGLMLQGPPKTETAPRKATTGTVKGKPKLATPPKVSMKSTSTKSGSTGKTGCKKDGTKNGPEC